MSTSRLTQTTRNFGKVLDEFRDNVKRCVLNGARDVAEHEYGDWMYALVLLSAVCHAIQSASYEAQRQEYEYWGWGRKAKSSTRNSLERTGTAPVIRWLF